MLQEPLPSIDVPVRDLGDFEWENPRVPPPPLPFDNAKEAFAAHSSLSMMRSLAVFSLCSIKVCGIVSLHSVFEGWPMRIASVLDCLQHVEVS